MIIGKNCKLVLIGDSITDANRSENGEDTPGDLESGLGRGYVDLINAQIQAKYSPDNIRIINRGISGNTILDLKERWQKDVLDLKPDWLSVMIGINDIWRQVDSPLQTELHVLPQQYKDTYDELLSKTRSTLKGLILITPYIISNDEQDEMRLKVNKYTEIVTNMAHQYDAILVEIQPVFDRFLEHRHSSSLAWDGIHPNTTGHMLIANEVLNKLQF